MSQRRFETGKTPRLTVSQVAGDLAITGWNASAVEVTGPDFSGDMAELDHVTLVASEKVEIHVPTGSRLTIQDVEGSIAIKHVDGPVSIESGQGNIELRDVSSVNVGRIKGDLSAENVSGMLTIGESFQVVDLRNVSAVRIAHAHSDVIGNYIRGFLEAGEILGAVSLHTISGDLTLNKVEGDVRLSNLGGGNTVKGVTGGIQLAGGLMSGDHLFEAEGDIILLWPVDAPLQLTATAAEIHNRLPLENVVETDSGGQQTVTGHIEEGQARLTLRTPVKIGLKTLYGRSSGPFEDVEFAFDFDAAAVEAHSLPGEESQTTSAAPPGDSIPKQVDGATLAETIAARVVQELADARLILDVDALEAIVTAAVAESLESSAGRPTSTEVAGAAEGRSSATLQQAEKAKRAVERSLKQAEESIEQARQKSQHSAQPKPGASPTASPPAGAESVVDEQTHILRLLKDGRLTVQQAALLLDNLPR